MFTKDDIYAVCPNARDDIVEALVNCEDLLVSDYGIDTPMKIAHFLAQTAHESGGFRLMEENLNYSSDRLMAVFPKYFRNIDARSYHRQPEKIANRVYANRMGNGDESTGDGYRFRGRGLIQLTGRNNYTMFSDEAFNSDLDGAVEYLSTPEGAVVSAAWFWDKANINPLAEEDDVLAVTKKINGGTHGLEDRRRYTDKFKDLLGA